MPVIARDAVASDQLVYAWPFPIGPEEHDVSCAEDELVVMCPAWLVSDRLGPGRHRWRSPDPTRPVSAYFVLTGPVDVSFDLITQFLIPTTGQPVRLRATGSLQVRCLDPALLVAQFVGLPFDSVNDGVVRSVSRSIERMLARLLIRRVVMAGTPQAVTDPSMLSSIVEELIAYNPTAGAVFGVELVRVGFVSIMADDGSRPWQHLTTGNGSRVQQDTNRVPIVPQVMPPSLTETAPGRPTNTPSSQPAIVVPPVVATADRRSGPIATEVSGEIVAKPRAATFPPSEVSGEINVKAHQPPPAPAPMLPAPPPTRPEKRTSLGHSAVPAIPSIPSPFAGTDSKKTAAPAATPSGAYPRAQSSPGITPPALTPSSPLPADPRGSSPGTNPTAQGTPAPEPIHESQGSILGIGMSAIGSASHVAPSRAPTVPPADGNIGPGGRVLVPGPNGLMQSATVRQLLSGYYELEVGGSGETIWVPVNGVVPE